MSVTEKSGITLVNCPVFDKLGESVVTPLSIVFSPGKVNVYWSPWLDPIW